jgi:hypothetical protein
VGMLVSIYIRYLNILSPQIIVLSPLISIAAHSIERVNETVK